MFYIQIVKMNSEPLLWPSAQQNPHPPNKFWVFLWWMPAPLQIHLLQIKPPTMCWKPHEIKTAKSKNMAAAQPDQVYSPSHTLKKQAVRTEVFTHVCSVSLSAPLSPSHTHPEIAFLTTSITPVCRGCSLVSDSYCPSHCKCPLRWWTAWRWSEDAQLQ